MYPIKFHPIYKEKIWGGEKLRTILNKNFTPLSNCGESWEISGVKDNVSIVKNGALAGQNLVDLIREYKGDLVGKKVYKRHSSEFPLLIKFIDANDDLSIQVHPNDDLAMKRHDSFGKTEMWYIVEADPDARLISGFNRTLDAGSFRDIFNRGRIEEVLNVEKAETDDVFFIPAGRIHTIGKGLLVAEIQQTSDVTYRLYDFDRIDANGHRRELHIEESIEAMDYQFYNDYKTSYIEKTNQAVELVNCSYFTTNKLLLTGSITRDYTDLDSFVILICLEGEGNVHSQDGTYTIKMGETILIPSTIKNIRIESSDNLKLLETFIS